MIGVAANPTDLDTAGEFFELFKTPWEAAVRGRQYSVVLTTDARTCDFDTPLVIAYGSSQTDADREIRVVAHGVKGPIDVKWGDFEFPIFGPAACFDVAKSHALTFAAQALDYERSVGSTKIRRIGYDIFQEVRFLLREGQPAACAATPTLELHIAFLRHVLVESGVSFIEVPPRPDGADFTCCLTHDVDFFGIRRHKLDRTLAGFTARASLGSLVDLLRGRRSLSEVRRNLMALVSLPLVFLGLLPDFWQPFEDYSKVEESSRSTFFLVPFKGRPGLPLNGKVQSSRAVAYQVSEIAEELTRAASRGAELAVHGIDAWRDSAAGKVEKSALTSVTGQQGAGVRMHWLYFGEGSARRLEDAGFAYDSTWGYNDAVGYRAGTSQVFRLPGSDNLLELPLSIMDTALFYRGQMDLTSEDALERCSRIVGNARRFGGTIVINWHDRSLAPERLWGRPYQALVEEIGRGDRVWFATASEAVAWFRWRRSIQFNREPGSNAVTLVASGGRPDVPAAIVHVHHQAEAAGDRTETRRFDGHSAVFVEL